MTTSPAGRPSPEWVLVPVEPTIGMFRALTLWAKDTPDAAAQMVLWATSHFREDYQAMIAAAPPAPQEKATDAMIEAASVAVVAEWQTMLREHGDHMSAADLARSFVSPGNYRLIRAALNAKVG